MINIMLKSLFYSFGDRQPSAVSRQPSTLHFKILKVISNRLINIISRHSFIAFYIYFIKIFVLISDYQIDNIIKREENLCYC